MVQRSAENSSLASLITESWNPLMEWLKRLEVLRVWVHGTPVETR